ncbi:HNH endonuclease domain-containing protein [uncultured Aquimarina sp.]|uniref:HNH endonuclease domain-containing protein n=1 Tax=uncultured Aquimarina sp. TaxID=575652 RepID=UPI0026231368|nr:HNH endonuclease domain-containing protein [uncultured Aquimarina sp.]
MSYQKRKDEVWNKASKLRDKDSNLYRKDDLRNILYYYSYVKNTEMGWEIDHSKPQSKREINHFNNLRVLKTIENRKKGNKY